jgi:hypothetical protein
MGFLFNACIIFLLFFGVWGFPSYVTEICFSAMIWVGLFLAEL